MTNDEFTQDTELDETQNSEVEETVLDDNTEDADDSADDKTDWKKEALKYKAILDRNKGKTYTKEAPTKKTDEFDYGQKAYLNTNGIKGAKEFDFVKAELKASGQDLDSLLENDYFKSRLEGFRALANTANAVPKGSRSGTQPNDSVEYWMSKPIEEVPQDMRIKVVNARLSKEKTSGVFYNSNGQK